MDKKKSINVDKIFQDIKNTIQLEIDQLELLKHRIDENFTSVVTRINDSKGKLVIVGIGKSAHIANKIVATLNSTGTVSQFLHASEAVHGDLGLVNKEDVVLCISNSGNSPEIKNVIPYLKKQASLLIGMTANKDSFLGQNSDLILDSFVTKEACPNNLAPTTSTTVQMVIGDALAVALMNVKDFKNKDFARFHPGGALGKNLLSSVEQVIPYQDKPYVYIDSNIKDVINSLATAKSGITVVFDNNENIKGVITDGDLRRMLVKYNDFNHLKANDIMSLNPKVIQKTELAKYAYNLLNDHNIGQLVILDNEKYFGILDIHHILDNGIK